MRRVCCCLALILGWAVVASPSATFGQLIPEAAALRAGLTRKWFTQIVLDPARGRIEHIVLDEGTLFIATDQGILQAVDAETGQTLWAERIGKQGHPVLPPDANSNVVALLSGSNLYLVNRHSGRLLREIIVEGAPSGGIALSERFAYVPTVTGVVYAYRLRQAPLPPEVQELPRDPTAPAELTAEEQAQLESRRREDFRLVRQADEPLVCPSIGHSWVGPAVIRESAAEEIVMWTTDAGMLFVGRVTGDAGLFSLFWRMETRGTTTAQPAYVLVDPSKARAGMLVFASQDGYVHALHESDGQWLWRFSTGQPIIQPVVAISRFIFVANQLGGMYCLDGRNGEQLWWTPDILQFVAASKHRLYATDTFGRLLALDGRTGAKLESLPLTGMPIRLINTQTDRIYLASENGLLQCLHEVDLKEPFVHFVPRPAEPLAEEADAAAGEPAAGAPAEPTAPPGGDPFAPAAAPGAVAPADDDPFAPPAPAAAAGAAPAGAFDAADDPFAAPAAAPAAPAPAGGAMDDPFAPTAPADQPAAGDAGQADPFAPAPAGEGNAPLPADADPFAPSGG